MIGIFLNKLQEKERAEKLPHEKANGRGVCVPLIKDGIFSLFLGCFWSCERKKKKKDRE